nr:unnamed protein product [Callosobruchus analis]
MVNNKDDLQQTMEDVEAQKTDQAPFRFEDFSFGPDLIDLNSSNSLLQSSFGNPSYLENDIQKNDSENHPEYSLTAAEIRDTLDYSDDYDDDPEYEPEEDSSEEDIDMQCQISPRITETSANGSTSFIENRFSNPVTEGVCDDTDMFVTRSRGSKGDKKTNVCLYCHKKQQKISRHILTVHKKEEVEKILALPRDCDERRQLIGNIRKKGNFVFNTNAGINDGELIVSRRPCTKFNRTASDFKPCAKCKAFFSKNSLRVHFRQCTGVDSSTRRIVMKLGKKVAGRVHKNASEAVKRHIFPNMREDTVTLAVRYDELLVIYANKMCQKYANSRHYEMIRQRIRLLGRFMLRLRKISDKVTSFTSIYTPSLIDDCIRSINELANFDEDTGLYKSPSVASNLGTLLKKVGNILITKCIKDENECKKKEVENFLKLLVEELNIAVNRNVTEAHLQSQRRKKIELPSMADIKKLQSYLLSERKYALDRLTSKFSKKSWLTLAESTLISVQLFNRRRAGEIERALIEDFYSYQGIDESSNKDIYDTLPQDMKEIAKKYVRFFIRGKLNRTVPVLLDKQTLQCINAILQNRTKFGVSKSNPYIFGLPNDTFKNDFKYLRACALLRRYAAASGAEHPERLRGTKLRKHIATTSVALNLADEDVVQLASFMGHHESIHKNIYRQPIISRDLRISKFLEAAQGSIESDTSSDSDITGEDPSSLTQNEAEHASPYGKVQRIRWSTDEKQAIAYFFRTNLDKKDLPSFFEIQQVITQCPELQRRTPAQVKTYISNQHRKLSRKQGTFFNR